MKAADILSFQLLGSCSLVIDAAEEAEPVWQVRAFAGASLPGFIVWHCARIIDWGVNTVVRGESELAASQQWSAKLRHDMGHGAGLSDAEADEVAATVRSEDVAAYTSGLRGMVQQWLDTVSDADLDAVPDLQRRNEEHARYSTPAAWEEVKHLVGIPTWQFLARPCIAHVRVHMGELDALLQQVRIRAVPAEAT